MFSAPDLNLSQATILPGMIIADFGAGIGAYAKIAAQQTGTAGKVYAVDVQKDLLARLKADAEHERISNIEFIWGDIEAPNGSKLATSSVDRVLAANILFQAEDKAAVIREAARILKPEGFLLVIDWSESFGGIGPTSEMIVPKETVQTLASEAGLTFSRETKAGEHHYGLLFKK